MLVEIESWSESTFEYKFQTFNVHQRRYESFVYEYGMLSPQQEMKRVEGFMLPVKRSWWQSILGYIHEFDSSYESKIFHGNLRDFKNTGLGTLQFKLLKDSTIIKEIKIVLKNKTFAIMDYLYEYYFLISAIIMFFLTSTTNLVIILIAFSYYFLRLLVFLEELSSITEKKKGKDPLHKD